MFDLLVEFNQTHNATFLAHDLCQFIQVDGMLTVSILVLSSLIRCEICATESCHLGARPKHSYVTISDPGIAIVLAIVAKTHVGVATDLFDLLVV